MVAAVVLLAPPASAQRAGENILTAAKDAFGTQLGRDNFGLYTPQSVRGFSPTQAGNNRIMGLYFDQIGGVTRGIRLGGSVKVGLATLDTPFPAPTGVVDTILRVPSEDDLGSTTIGIQRTYRGNFEFEKEVNLSPRVAFTLGGLAEYRHILNGDRGRLHGLGLTGRLRPADGIELIPFLGSFTNYREFSPPRWFTRDRLRPPAQVNRFRIIGPSWATDGQTATNGGLITRLRPDDSWDIDIGLFRAVQIRQDSHSTLVRDIDAEGIGNRIVISDPRQLRASWSGEARVSHRFATGDLAHTLIGSVRGRRVDARIGGAARVDLGRFGLDERVELPRPAFAYGPLTSDKVDQTIYGLGYQGRWGRFAEVAGGIQYNDYLKRIDQPGQPLLRLPDKAVQLNGTAAVNLTSRLAVYGAFTEGLEETPNPPPEAVNRNDLLPAQRTEQFEAGVRVKLPASLTLNAAAFAIEKPLFALDDSLLFRPRGTLRHRGVEASLAGAPARGLTLLVGGLFLNAANSGEEVGIEGGLGRRAVARSRLSGRLALDWRPDEGSSPWSFDLVMEGNGPAEATRDNFTRGPSALDIDIGMRYRFSLGQNAALFRVQLVNLSNVYRWQVAGDGAWTFNEPRSVVAFLTVDI